MSAPMLSARLSVLAGTLSFALVAGAPARAEERDAAAADQLFRDGRKAAERGDWATACPKFAQSLRLDPAVGTRLNLADCEENRGHVGTAFDAFQRALEQLPPKDDRVGIVRQRMAALAPRVPRLTLHLSAAAPDGTELSRDDVAVDPDVALPVDPGEHVVTVRAKGHKDERTTVSLREGQALKINVAPGEEDASVAAPPPRPPREKARSRAPEPPSSPSSGRTVGWIVGGVGLAGLAAAGVTGAMVESRKSTVDANCDPDKACNQAGLDAASQGKTLVKLNAAAWAVGLVGVGVGAYLVLSSDGPSGGSTKVGAALAPGGAGVSLVETF